MGDPMNVLDIILLVIVLLSILMGVLKGFIREIFSLVFMAVAVLLAFWFYPVVGKWFQGFLDNSHLANFAAFISIFVVVLIIGSVVTYIIKKVLAVGPLKSVDRILGGVFGLLRGVVISAVIVFGLIVFPVNGTLVKESRLSPYVVSAIKAGLKIMPKKYSDQVRKFEKDKKK